MVTNLDVVGERGFIQVAHELVCDGPELICLDEKILGLWEESRERKKSVLAVLRAAAGQGGTRLGRTKDGKCTRLANSDRTLRLTFPAK